MERIEHAVILAAGEGQRLRPFTATRPKVMINIANKPILRYVIEAVAKNGIRNSSVVLFISRNCANRRSPGFPADRSRNTQALLSAKFHEVEP